MYCNVMIDVFLLALYIRRCLAVHLMFDIEVFFNPLLDGPNVELKQLINGLTNSYFVYPFLTVSAFSQANMPNS